MCGTYFMDNWRITKHLQKKAWQFLWCPVEDINILNIFHQIQKFLRASCALIITTNGINLAGPFKSGTSQIMHYTIHSHITYKFEVLQNNKDNNNCFWKKKKFSILQKKRKLKKCIKKAKSSKLLIFHAVFVVVNTLQTFIRLRKINKFVLIVNIIINKSLKINHDQAYKILFDGIFYIININT